MSNTPSMLSTGSNTVNNNENNDSSLASKKRLFSNEFDNDEDSALLSNDFDDMPKPKRGRPRLEKSQQSQTEVNIKRILNYIKL